MSLKECVGDKISDASVSKLSKESNGKFIGGEELKENLVC